MVDSVTGGQFWVNNLRPRVIRLLGVWRLGVGDWAIKIRLWVVDWGFGP